MTQESKRIYLADDDDDDCMLFQDALNEMNFKIELTVSKDGEELMKTFEKKVPPPPHILFLDLNMPRKSGFECLREMKQDAKLKDIPVVIFSTSGDQGNIQRTFHEGANLYVRKPGTFETLKRLIEKVLSINWKDDVPRQLEGFVLLP